MQPELIVCRVQAGAEPTVKALMRLPGADEVTARFLLSRMRTGEVEYWRQLELFRLVLDASGVVHERRHKRANAVLSYLVFDGGETEVTLGYLSSVKAGEWLVGPLAELQEYRVR